MSTAAPKQFLHLQASDSTLINNLHHLMRNFSVSEAELSRRTHIPQPTLHKILSGKTSDPRMSTLKSLATFFNIPLDALCTTNIQKSEKAKHHAISIPVISWSECTRLPDFINEISPNNWENWIVINPINQSNMFALVSKPSMEARFPRSTMLIIDPKLYPSDGDLAVVLYPSTHEATLRGVSFDGPQKLLLPITPNAAPDTLDDSIQIIGTVVQSRFSYQK